MILSLIFAALIAQDAPAPATSTPAPVRSSSATPSPSEPFLGVRPPNGYTYANGLPVPMTYRLWTIGEKPKRSGIGVLLFPGYAGTARDYADNKFLSNVETDSSLTSFQVTGERAITICGGPGWEMREAFVADEGPRFQISVFRATPKYVIVAHYQRPQSLPADPLAVAAIQKLCPPTQSKQK